MPVPARPNHYQTLGLDRTATDTAIKLAVRRLVMEHHPDRGGNPARFQEIIAARDVLMDPEARALYDARLATSEPPAWVVAASHWTMRHARPWVLRMGRPGKEEVPHTIAGFVLATGRLMGITIVALYVAAVLSVLLVIYTVLFVPPLAAYMLLRRWQSTRPARPAR
jgi:hypothetical protein